MVASISLKAPDGSTFLECTVGRGDFGIIDGAFGRQQFRLARIDGVPEMLQLTALGQNPLVLERLSDCGSWELDNLLDRGQETGLHLNYRFYLAGRKETTTFTVVSTTPERTASPSTDIQVEESEDEGSLRPNKRVRREANADVDGCSTLCQGTDLEHLSRDRPVGTLQTDPRTAGQHAPPCADAGPSRAQGEASAGRAGPSGLQGGEDVTDAPFSLLAVRGIPDWANRPPMGMRLQHVVRGPMKWALISNYMIDLGWLLSACPDLKSAGKLVVVHGERGPDTVALMREDVLAAGLQDRVTIHAPPLPIAFGTHHSKAFLLEFDGGVRLVVHTANLILPDNNNKSQGLWYQDFPLKDAQSPRTTEFEKVLADYVSALGLPQEIRAQALEVCHAHDFSSARAHLIVSRPGYHKGQYRDCYGHMRLRAVLRRETLDSIFQKSSLSAQFSSLGSLDEGWVNSEFLESMAAENGGLKQLGAKQGKLQLIWPTVEEVQNSLEGWQAGCSIPGFRKNVQKPFLQSQWHRYGGESAGRQRAMPHIKTFARYCEVPGIGARLAWILLTSCNLSIAAWGKLQMNGSQLFIRSYEMGVLLMPRLEETYTKHRHHGFACAPSPAAAARSGQVAGTSIEFWHRDSAEKQMDDSTGVRRMYVPLPYHLKPAQYNATDRPWMADGSFDGLDSLGRRMGEPGAAFYGNIEPQWEALDD